jgi:hypothetical protein
MQVQTMLHSPRDQTVSLEQGAIDQAIQAQNQYVIVASLYWLAQRFVFVESCSVFSWLEFAAASENLD